MGTRVRRVVHYTPPAALALVKGLLVPTQQEVRWPLGQTWTFWRRESFYLCRESNPKSFIP